MLEIDEIEGLYEQVIEKIREKMFIYNRDENPESLNNYLLSIGMDSLLSTVCPYETYKSGKIVILGQTSIDKGSLYGIAQSLGIEKDRLELCLDFESIEKYNFRKLRYEPKYRVVLVGPMPHSSHGAKNHSSAIAEMEQEPGYPRVIRLTANQELKITKSNLKSNLQQLVDEKYI